DAPPLFLETMNRLYGKYFGEGAAPEYKAYWVFMRPRGDGGSHEACFLACMMELAKKNGDDQHLAFIEKEYKRVMSRPVIIYSRTIRIRLGQAFNAFSAHQSAYGSSCAGRMSTLSMRRPSISTTSRMKSPTRTVSPSVGMRSSRARIIPA